MNLIAGPFYVDPNNIGETEKEENLLMEIDPHKEVKITNGVKDSYFLFLKGCSINGPLANCKKICKNTDIQSLLVCHGRIIT
jgi:hypothetical protein